MNGNMHHRKIIALIVFSTIFGRGKSEIPVKPVTTGVQVGDSTYLNCSISGSVGDVSWYHYLVGVGIKRHRFVYTLGQLNDPYDRRFRIEKRKSSGTFNLILVKAELEDAGLYVCQEKDNSKNSFRTELIVYETNPICETNINGSIIIGANRCGLEEDAIHLSCSMRYRGNVPPEMQLSRVRGNRFHPIPRALGSCYVADGGISCSYTLQSEPKIDGSYFVCQVTRSRKPQYSCMTDIARIFFEVGDDTRKEKSVGDEATCSVNSSYASCSYKWIWFDGSRENVISENQYLRVTKVGLHKCQASCLIKQLPCNFDAMVFESIALSRANPWIPLTIATSFLGVVVIVLFVCLATLAVRTKAKKNEANGQEKSSLIDDKVMSLEATIEELNNKIKEIKEENDQLKKLHDKDRKIVLVETDNINKRRAPFSGHSSPYSE